MKPLFFSPLLATTLCFYATTSVWAKPKPANTNAKKSVLVKFVITDPNGNSQQGSTGDYLPSADNVNPASKGYYVTLSASIVVPQGTAASNLPSTLQLRAKRVRRVATPTGTTKLIFVGPVLDNLPELKLLPNPTLDGNNIIYKYGTYQPNNHNNQATEEMLRVAKDWNVAKERGRWEISVQRGYGASNYTHFKIDKRSQITNSAINWADYVWNYHPTWNTGGPYWNLCNGFVAYVYSSHGLTGLPNTPGNGRAQLAAATASDDGPGSLRFFWTEASPVGDPGHVAIIGPPTRFTRSGTRIDNNGSAPRDFTTADGSQYRYNGPTFNSLDDGVGEEPGYLGFSAGAKRPQSFTLPSVRTPGKSLLEELDAE